MMAAPVMESSPMAIASITIIGAKAMNRFTPCVVQIRANTRVRIGMKIYNFPENLFASFATIA